MSLSVWLGWWECVFDDGRWQYYAGVLGGQVFVLVCKVVDERRFYLFTAGGPVWEPGLRQALDEALEYFWAYHAVDIARALLFQRGVPPFIRLDDAPLQPFTDEQVRNALTGIVEVYCAPEGPILKNIY